MARALATTATKPWWQSVTIWGAVFTAIGTFVLPLFHLTPPPPDAISNFAAAWSNAIDAVVTVGGLVMTLWGRIRATKQVTVVPQ